MEDGLTYRDNAFKKAEYWANKNKCNVISDDSGFEISSLNKFPGVNTKTWCYPIIDNNLRNNLILKLMHGISNRKAIAKTVICYYDYKLKKAWFFEGILEGTINNKVLGNNGFGYDSIFFIKDIGKTLAQLTEVEKNKISHRSKSLKLLIEFLNKVSIYE